LYSFRTSLLFPTVLPVLPTKTVSPVKRILDFGAIVGLSPTLDGLIHISELAKERVKQVTDILNEGDEVLVKCISKERDGKIRLSRKEALDEDIDNYREI